MGNCNFLMRKNIDPNRVIDNAQPPAGVDRIIISRVRKNFAAAEVNWISSIPSNILQCTENPCQDRRCGYQQRGCKSFVSSNPQKAFSEKNAEMLGKREVYHAHKLSYCFCHDVLVAATRKFSKSNLIGQGGFGDVYLGYINSSTMTAAKGKRGDAIAVKRLRSKGFQGLDEWKTELRLLRTLNHPNVIKLKGHCCEGEHRILVYEYMPEGSLEDHLLSENDGVLNWNQRIKIALGAARGLEYLHNHWMPVIHRDIKASNVLLDSDFNAKLSDFGLAKFGPQGDKSHVSTRVLGTKGYFAPEYIATGHLTAKTDIYSFGVVLLDILLGRNAVKKYPGYVAGKWAKPYLSNKLELQRVIDAKIARNIRIEEAQEFAEIILKCLKLEAKSRPTMTQVGADLEQLELHIGGCYQELTTKLSTQEERTSPFDI